jgi:hypothetical protein
MFCSVENMYENVLCSLLLFVAFIIQKIKHGYEHVPSTWRPQKCLGPIGIDHQRHGKIVCGACSNFQASKSDRRAKQQRMKTRTF